MKFKLIFFVIALASAFSIFRLSTENSYADPVMIDASRIGAGTVTNEVFGYLANVTGDIEAALSGKQTADADLTTLSAPGADKIIYSDGSGNIQTVTLGANGTYLKSQGTGSAPIFGTVSATPGGSDTHVQFNDNGVFGGDAGFVYDKNNNNLTIDNTIFATQFIAIQSAVNSGTLKLFELSGNGTDYMGYKAPDSITASLFLRFPDDTPSDEFLQCAAPSGGISDCIWSNYVKFINYGSDPTVAAAGAIGIDNTANQLKYYGTALKIIDSRFTENASFKSPTSGDRAKFRKPFGMTVDSVGCVTDAATSVVLDIQECNSSGASCTTILSSSITCGTTYGTGTISDSSITAANYVFFSVGTVTGTPEYLYVDFNYSITGE